MQIFQCVSCQNSREDGIAGRQRGGERGEVRRGVYRHISVMSGSGITDH